MKKLLVISVLSLCLFGCVKNLNEETTRFKEEYEALNDSGIKVNITKGDVSYLDEVEALNFIKEGTGIIYFGFPACPWCRNIVPILLDTDETIYYVNVRSIDKESDAYQELFEILTPYLEVNEQGIKTLYVPDVYFVKDGEIVGHHLGSVESQDNPYEPLTSKQKKELKNIYLDLIDKIK